MLTIKKITKNYTVGDMSVAALNGVSLNFRKSEFVSVLGPSGCGKTTLLNIIGGLDRYSDGDIIINGISTKDYKDSDWDTYRNHSVGFVFQSYNLIPHQSVLKNVELALTLSGINREERRVRAKAALEKVGLGDQLNKRPNQISGGQMQRVAIARAIVNDPDIILADEPTGALDTETSVQVLDILKELSKTKLVIMVTHNPELAGAYSTRIIRLKDGVILSDTQPYESEAEGSQKSQARVKKPSMSFLTALFLSLNNLATKKTRTILTSFAGSIGIIGIALILSISTGFNAYIARIQQETLTNYPLTITSTTIDLSSLVSHMLGETAREGEKYPNSESVTTQHAISDLVDTVAGSASTNDLKSFKAYLDANIDKDLVSAIKYSYDVDFNVYRKQTVKGVTSYNQVEPTNLPDVYQVFENSPQMAAMMKNYYNDFSAMLTSQPQWIEIIDNRALIEKQYDYLSGEFPEHANEMLLVVDEYNQISDLALYMMGLMTDDDISYIFNRMILMIMPKEDGTTCTEEEADLILAQRGMKRSEMTYTFDQLLNLEYSVALGTELYEKDTLISDDGLFSEDLELQTYKKRGSQDIQQFLENDAYKLKISGIIRLKKGISNGALNGTLCYTKQLTELLIEKNNAQQIVKDYQAEAKKAEKRAQLSGSDSTDQYYFSVLDGTPLSQKAYIEMQYRTGTNELALNIIDINIPSAISIYPVSFEKKDAIIQFINDYNAQNDETKQIKYNDFIGMMMSSITVIINAITYILISFVSISLIVSSIMIGIITYISVLERTKEIGVLRSIGASKRDVKRVFNAETIIIGFAAGIMGIIITLLLNIPINLVILALAEISGVAALPVWGGVILVTISVVLTTVAGLIPASIASKKDPVVALRTE